MHYLPLHSLLLNDEQIIQKYPISYCPNGSLIKYYEKRELKTIAAFGAGEEEFNQEAVEIANIFNSLAITEATKAQVLENIDKDILHFSCHGFFDTNDPLASGIELAKSSKGNTGRHVYERLNVKQIFDLRMRNTRLVTLSACDSGKNFLSRGEN